MIGRQERWQEDLFVAGPLRDLIPDDHILRRLDNRRAGVRVGTQV